MSYDNSDGVWERLCQVAIKGAEYNSPERQPHPKCLKETRVDFLAYIHGLLDNPEMSRLVWMHGTAGVGKSAVAFTVAERMKGLQMTEKMPIEERRPHEKRLAGTFFFSRKYENRCTTGYFFATLAYQLASNFSSIRDELTAAIRENPALLDSQKCLCDQMEALFLRPLRRLRPRLSGCPPLVFVVDALDECTSETDIADLISLLGQALHERDLPVIHILLTSRSEAHIRDAINEEDVHPLVYEVPVEISGKGVTSLISLDGADVDNDIYIFLKHSFTKLQSRYPNFPRLTEHNLERLVSRAGRRFIVASTMLKFIDDGYSDPRDRLQLMLELTSDLLPGTEVHKLYDGIISTCADPKRAYLHLSVVAALANPLPLSQISELLGPGQGRDVETVLVQLRSVIDIPTDRWLPVSIYHSSVRDYVSERSNCSLFNGQYITPSPHSLLAESSFRLMIHSLPESTGLLDALSKLKTQSQVMESRLPQNLRNELDFIVEPLTALGVFTTLLWLRGDRSPVLYPWLESQNGRAWLRTQGGKDWLGSRGSLGWLQTQGGLDWLRTQSGEQWLRTSNGRWWLQTQGGQEWLGTEGAKEWLGTEGAKEWLGTEGAKEWLETESTKEWLDTKSGQDWLWTQNGGEWLQTQSGQEWLQTQRGRAWLRTYRGREWLRTRSTREWLQIQGGRKWLQTQRGREWLQTHCEREWLKTRSGREWLQTRSGREWLQTQSGREWLQTQGARKWLQTSSAREWLQTPSGQEWLQTWSARGWIHTQGGREWLQTPSGREWLQTPSGQEWLQSYSGWMWLLHTQSGREWLQTPSGREWLQTPSGQERLQTWSEQEWLQTQYERDCQLQTPRGRKWLQTQSGREWLQTPSGQEWLQTWRAQEWLHTPSEREWLQTPSGREWLQTPSAREWLQTPSEREWLQTPSGREWLQTPSAREWLQTLGAREWLRTQSAREWLQTQDGREWLQTPLGKVWLSTPSASFWVKTEEFLHTVEAINKFIIFPESSLLPTFQAIQQIKNLPDFLMFPVFLTSAPRFSPSSAHNPDVEIIHIINAFVCLADKARERSRPTSAAIMYACQHWATHLSRAPRDNTLDQVFRIFWNHYLLSWLERYWYSRGLRSCLVVLSDGQKYAKKHSGRILGLPTAL